jgi:serralysin
MAYITGTAAANLLLGTAGNDVINGLEGNDLIDGGAGNDVLIGGLGADTFRMGLNEGYDAIVDADGTDVLLLTGGPFFDIFAFQRDGTDLVIRAVDNHDYSSDPPNQMRVLNHFAGSRLLYVEGDFSGNNAGYGEDPAVTRFYFSGANGVGINQGNFGEALIGADGNDTIVGNGGYFDSVDSGAGNDRVNTVGARFANVITGDGNDYALGGNGRETFRGGRGLDTFDGGGQGADGGDRVDYRDADGAIQVDLALTTLQWIGDYDGADLLLNIEGVIGSKFNDTISGNADNNLLVGRDGRDILNGRAGADTMDGGLDNDTYYVDNLADLILELPNTLFVAGNDRVIVSVNNYDMGTQALYVERIDLVGAALNATGNGSNNVMRGNAGANSLSGAIGNDQLFGFGGNDVLIGGPATIGGSDRDDDRLVGGLGADTMTGGAGRDLFDFNSILESGIAGAARDVITDFTTSAVAGQFVDRIDLRDIDALAATLTVNEAFTFLGGGAFTAAGAQVRVQQVGADVEVQLNTDADLAPEMVILLKNQTAANLEAIDFLL